MRSRYGYTLYSADEFDKWLQETRFNRAIHLIQNHHTWLPAYGNFTGNNHFDLLRGMELSHRERGFSEIAQNVTTFPDGTLAVCRPFDHVPAGIKGANSNGICIEHLGNFDQGKDLPSDPHRETIIRVNALLCREFSLTPSIATIVYHHWYDLVTGVRTDGKGTTKSCPGSAFFGGNTVATAAEKFIPLVLAACSACVPATNPSASADGEAAIVTANALNVRSSTTAEAPLVAVLQRGAMVGVYERQRGWCRIHPRDQHWVSGKYLSFQNR
ncbi:N-acetylmuramoyl-L-alanine amidase [Geobacter argillaceus]|uniref:SH3 domain-containing protein n=1 Tax=Geobacter argillaceus TaxID=345631 RepID=A0A562VIM3_9BACT|nr:N-acetylmuramoyl-L-alanine amidase [Geobacter argillaceus]TWJ17765.1 SH3 domain-containing protein [Geobacter argillaceus]